MGILDFIKERAGEHFDKKREDREKMDELRKEAEMHRRLMFEEEFRKNSFEVAKAQAFKDAAKASGLQKLRATNRARRLSQQTPDQQPMGFLSKLGEHTKRNLANRESNLERTAEMRSTAKEIRETKLAETKRLREERMGNNLGKRGFVGGGFGR